MNKKTIGIAIVLIVVAIFAIIGFTSTRINEVYVGVMYDGAWSGAIGDTSSMNTWSAEGNYVIMLERPKDMIIWIVSANAQKLDASNNKLTIMIFLKDNIILAESSTTSAHGIAQVSCEVKRP